MSLPFWVFSQNRGSAPFSLKNGGLFCRRGPARKQRQLQRRSRGSFHLAGLAAFFQHFVQRIGQYMGALLIIRRPVSCFSSGDDTHRRYSAPPAPPAAPCRWYSSPRPRHASSNPHIPPASECIPDPTRASYRPDRKSPPARWHSAHPSPADLCRCGHTVSRVRLFR